MIIVRLKGGLGNQLFQYALGRNLAIQHQTDLILDTTSFEKDHLRTYRLNSFQIKAKPSDRFWFFPDNRIGRRLNPLLEKVRALISQSINVVQEASFAFDPLILNTPNFAYLNGYWQSEKYFGAIQTQLREDLRLSQALSDLQQSLASKINRNPFAVSLHVRRGDYVADPTTTAFHGLCSLEWYARAAELILTKEPQAQFYIFSDDYKWVKENLTISAPIHFIEPSPDGQEAIDMHLMSLCKHNIIANSSFSWWGAWLNNNPKKIVIAPNRWFATDLHNTIDLIPSEWIRL